MLETINKLLAAPVVERYRKLLLLSAASLLLLHLSAFVLPFVFPHALWIKHLDDFSANLLGVTEALVIVVILGAAIRALSDADKRWRSEAYRFIENGLRDWFASGSPAESQLRVEEVVSQTYTDLKVKGAEQLIDLADQTAVHRYCSEIHFEFTFYPTKLVYGIHFESPSREINETMLDKIRKVLALDDESGFAIDHQVPKKPAWLFFIRTVAISGDFERDLPQIMTHARHFVELVGHSYTFVYNRPMAEQFRELIASDRLPSPK
jgi:hypothetical protein